MEHSGYDTKNRFATLLVSGGLLLFIFSLSIKSLALWDHNGLTLYSNAKAVLVSGAILCVLGILLNGLNLSGRLIMLELFAFAICLVFLSDWLNHRYNFFQGPSIRGEIIFMSLCSFFFVNKAPEQSLPVTAILAITLCIGCFFWESAGRLIFSDDHSTFLYRLELLKENFPSIPFYNPFWNGGIDNRDFFATGALNVFLLFSPLIYLYPVEQIYNFIVVGVLFVLLPLSSYCACRLVNLKHPAPAIASILSVSTSLTWFEWGLKYGTMGFVTSTSLLPLLLALTCRLLNEHIRLTLTEAILYVLLFSLVLLWSPSGLVLIPAMLIGLAKVVMAFCGRGALLKKRLLIPLAVAIIAINLPWISIFWSVSNVSKFIKSEKPAYTSMAQEAEASLTGQHKTFKKNAASLNLKDSLKALREKTISTNPLLIFMLLPGLTLIGGLSGWLIAATSLWLLIMGAGLSPLKPQLELDRMLVILQIIACIPAAAAISTLMKRNVTEKSGIISRSLVALISGFLLSGPLATAAITVNHSLVKYYFKEPKTDHLIETIRNLSVGGRIAFSGFVLHELNHAHLAPLAYLTGKPLMASSYVHNLWRYKQLFPHSFINRRLEGIEEYLDLYNVSAIFAHERRWKKFFTNHPEKFVRVATEGRFHLFVRKDFKSSYFLKGQGKVLQQNSNSVTLKLKSKDAVIKYNYFPFLEATGCAVKPYQAAPEVVLVELENCPLNRTITLKSMPAYRRLLFRS
ncbi:MAG: hypothetical protein D6719_13140 [Candidatus Dadabacteria bacterium]|nr:MAG: hypothetical protein D6719_13140 [Candidatus Dadabacteria bacterium]